MNRKDLWVQWLLERIKYDLDEQPGEQEWNRLKSNLDFAFTQFLKDLDDARRKARLEQEKKYQWVRFNITIRLQHFILALSVAMLFLTGLPIKFHDAPWAGWVFSLLGGIETGRIIHRFSACLLMFVSLWHVIYIAFFPNGKREFSAMIPRMRDFYDIRQNFRFFLGLTKERPRFDRYSYIEKFDYWAVIWGTVLMILSGLIMWFHDLFLWLLPKFLIDIARQTHTGEAMLAMLAIVVWHLYNSHLNPHVFPMNWSMITGRVSREWVRTEHPLEYERLIQESGEGAREPDHEA